METVFSDPATNSYLRVQRGYLPADQADEALETALSYDWESRKVLIYGKWIDQPREVLLVGDSKTLENGSKAPIVTGYKYSGQEAPLYIWDAPDSADPEIPGVVDRYYYPREICRSINSSIGGGFNSCLIIRYLTGKNYISYHSDDERQLGENGQVVTVSLGASRKFRLRKKGQTSGYCFETTLHHGDLVIMDGDMQSHYMHSIIKELKVVEPRISLTYRRLSW